MFWPLRQYTDDDLIRNLKRQSLLDFFKYNPEAKIDLIQGTRATRIESSFNKGVNYGNEITPVNLFPVGTIGHALAWRANQNKVFHDWDGTYEVQFDFETYRLFVDKNGLQQTITHFFRVGRCIAAGPDSAREKRLRNQIGSDRFCGSGTSFSDKSEYWFLHKLPSAHLIEIVSRSNLSPRKILKVLKNILPGEIGARVQDKFQPLRAFGVEQGVVGTLKRSYFDDKWKNFRVEEGRVVENRMRYGSGVWK